MAAFGSGRGSDRRRVPMRRAANPVRAFEDHFAGAADGAAVFAAGGESQANGKLVMMFFRRDASCTGRG